MKIGERSFKATVTVRRHGGALLIEGSDLGLLAIQVLRHQREVHALSLADVAKKLGASSLNAYAAYEQGRRAPSLSKFSELLAVVAPELGLVVEKIRRPARAI